MENNLTASRSMRFPQSPYGLVTKTNKAKFLNNRENKESVPQAQQN
jgi:hypothetical protein